MKSIPKIGITMECKSTSGSLQKLYLFKRRKNKNTALIFLKGVKKCVKPAIKMLAGATAALLIAMWLVPMVTEQRGYSAIGGEYLLIVLSAFIAIHIANRLIEKR